MQHVHSCLCPEVAVADPETPETGRGCSLECLVSRYHEETLAPPLSSRAKETGNACADSILHGRI